MLFSALLFVPIFLLNLAHMRYRRVPLYSWGTVIAVVHLVAGTISFILLPIAAVLISIIVEVVNALMSDNERNKLSAQYDQEIKQTEERIEAAQHSYEELHCLITFTADQDYDYRQALKKLEQAGIWNYVRGGLITSILVKPEDAQKAEACLGIEPAPESDDPGPGPTSAGSTSAVCMLAMVTILAASGCSYRGSSSDLGLIPVVAAITQAVADGNSQVPRRSTEQILADLDSIPPEITEAIDRRQDISADTADELLTLLGLAPYRSRLVTLGSGDPLTPEQVIYYRKDAFVTYRLDAVRQRILGTVRVVPAVGKVGG